MADQVPQSRPDLSETDVLSAARSIEFDPLGPDAIVGGSPGNLDELARFLAAGVDYLGVGPMYPTGSKSDAGSAIGPTGLAAIRASTDLPIVGIGGIDALNLRPVIAAGADGVAIISAIVGAEDVAAVARQIRAEVEAALARSRR